MSVDVELFRVEALASARSRMGRPVEISGVASWTLVLLMTCALSVTVVFLCLTRYAKKETVLGEVTPAAGVARISSPKSGLVKAVLAPSGRLVRAGQPLFLVSYDSILEGGGFLGGQINAATQAQLLASERQGAARAGEAQAAVRELDAKVDNLVGQIGKYEAQRAIQVDRIALLEKTASASRDLAAQNLMSSVVLRQREDSLLAGRQGLIDLDRSITEARGQIAQAKAQRASLTDSQREAAASLDLAQAQLEEKRLEGLAAQGAQIVAPKDGRLTNVQVRKGDVVEAGSPLGLLAPDASSDLEVTLWVPSRAVGFVEPGGKVRLMFDAFPYQTYGVVTARVSEIARAPIMPADLPIPIETKEQMYKITAHLDQASLRAYGKDWPLVPGMRLTADMILSEKSLLDWLLDPIAATRARARV